MAKETPREVLRGAYRAGWLVDEATWLGMLRDRNESSHLYDENLARRIYANLPLYLQAMEQAYTALVARTEQDF